VSDAKRVVMVAGDGESTRIVYNHLRREVGVAGVVLEGPVDLKEFLKRRVRRLGLPTVAGQLLFKALVDKPLELRSSARVREIKRALDLDGTAIPEDACVRVPSINAPEALAALAALDPAVVVVSGTRIIAKKVLEAVRVPFINMHAGITPLYRGVHGAYWALAEGDREHCGVTVHLVDAGIDTGGILGQARIDPTDADNFTTYPLLQTAAGLPLLVDAVKAALGGSLRPQTAPHGSSRLWSHPTLGQYVRARLQNGTR
jgi:folate-dependent phosphoribosylglycinamide formyltransferase PurN